MASNKIDGLLLLVGLWLAVAN